MQRGAEEGGLVTLQEYLGQSQRFTLVGECKSREEYGTN